MEVGAQAALAREACQPRFWCGWIHSLGSIQALCRHSLCQAVLWPSSTILLAAVALMSRACRTAVQDLLSPERKLRQTPGDSLGDDVIFLCHHLLPVDSAERAMGVQEGEKLV